ncbi:MAG: sugar phosphate isomerase/epimerase [Clostridia bacterium]|nr:sugar phosphate isomerase/epimerase [Clostridia bacterium]
MAKYILSAFADEAGKSLDEQIAALQRNGIKFMEIRNVDGVNICQTPLKTVAEYKEKLDAAGIRVLTIGSCIGKADPGEKYQEHVAMFLHTLGVAKILGAERIRMFSLFNYDKETVFAKMRELLDIAEGTGITLYHENEKDVYGDIDQRVLELMEAFGGRMKFIFDPANFIQCGCYPLDIYPALKDKIDYFHIKDARFATGSVVPSGKGDGAIAQLLTDFAEDHENVMLTIEPHLKSFDGLKDTKSIREDEFVYKDHTESFDAAVNALKDILQERGLSYE